MEKIDDVARSVEDFIGLIEHHEGDLYPKQQVGAKENEEEITRRWKVF